MNPSNSALPHGLERRAASLADLPGGGLVNSPRKVGPPPATAIPEKT
jgi:hypothetical protein